MCAQQYFHLFIGDRKGRAGLLRLIVIEGDQQPLAARTQQAIEMLGVLRPHQRRQCNQRRAIIERAAIGHGLSIEGEEVAAPHLDHISLIHAEHAMLADTWRQPLLAEEGLHRLLRQLHPQHGVPMAGQPHQVQAFATQRHQHFCSIRQAQLRPMPLQMWIDLRQVKSDLIARPALPPKCRLHKSP